MARKSKGRSGCGGGGNGSGPSSSSPASRPQQDAAAASSSTSSPIPCPPGYLWDGKRFYKMPPNLSRVRITDGSSSSSGSESERPEKKPKIKSSVASPASSSRHREGTNASPLQDITAVAFAGEDDEDDGSNVGSAFDFTPAKPPAAHLSLISPSCEASAVPPRGVAHSMVFAKRWQMHATQRHVDSYKFHSRDIVSRHVMPWAAGRHSYDDDYDEGPWSDVRVDSFDSTGGLIWLQAEAKKGHAPYFNDDFDSDDCTRGATFLESAGRSYAQERFLPSSSRRRDDDRSSPPERRQIADDSWDRYGNQSHLYHSHVGFSSSGHPMLDSRRECRTRLYGFDRNSALPRALVGQNHNLTANGRQWPQYKMSNMSRTITARVDPGLLLDVACYDLLHPPVAYQGSKRPTELTVFVTVTYGAVGMQIIQINWAPAAKTLWGVPDPSHKQEHSAIALNEGTALCWLGYSDGRIELFDPAGYTADVISSYPRYQHLVESVFDALKLAPPTFSQVLEGSSTRGAVSSLNAVGPREVVATFSNGAMLLLRATSSQRVEVVREYFGCKGKGSRLEDPSVDAASRLVAIVDEDKHVRIWHLDDSYPLNTPWHRKRKRNEAEPLDLLPDPKSQHQKLLQRTKASSSSQSSQDPDAAITPHKHKDKFIDPLALRPLTNNVTQTVMQKPLADLKLWLGCGMTFSPTSWLADRDGQWEFTRGFANGKPKLVGAGLFPGLVCCISSPRGPALLYFEPGRGEGVRIEGTGEGEGRGGGEGEGEREGEGSEMMENVEGQ